MTTQIKTAFDKMGSNLTTYNKFFGAWSANSQYGYTMSWHKTEEEAVESVVEYYTPRMRLLTQ